LQDSHEKEAGQIKDEQVEFSLLTSMSLQAICQRCAEAFRSKKKLHNHLRGGCHRARITTKLMTESFEDSKRINPSHFKPNIKHASPAVCATHIRSIFNTTHIHIQLPGPRRFDKQCRANQTTEKSCAAGKPYAAASNPDHKLFRRVYHLQERAPINQTVTHARTHTPIYPGHT
jgi:hypothetical protein